MKLVAALIFVLLLPISILLPIQVEAYPSGIVSYWQFDESAGTNVTDSVGTNIGTIDGASRDTGLVNGALRFDGINDIVRLPSVSGYADFTMSAWFISSSIPSGAVLQTGMGYIEVGTEVGSTDICALFLTFADRQGGGGIQSAYQYHLPKIDFEGNWHYIVMTGNADNSELSAYFDGNLVASLTWGFSGWNSTLNYSNIGALKASMWPGNQEGMYFNGFIDEVALFNRELSPEEVSLYYQTGLDGLDLSIFNPCPAPVPEPTTMLLLASGLAGLAGVRRLKKR